MALFDFRPYETKQAERLLRLKKERIKIEGRANLKSLELKEVARISKAQEIFRKPSGRGSSIGKIGINVLKGLMGTGQAINEYYGISKKRKR